MTPEEFQKNHGQELKEILQSPIGGATILTLNGMRPNYEPSTHQHIFLENRGVVRGYEMCLRNLASLTFVPTVRKEVEPNYGVKEPEKTEAPKPAWQAPSSPVDVSATQITPEKK